MTLEPLCQADEDGDDLRYGSDLAAMNLLGPGVAELEAAVRSAMLQSFRAVALIGAALAVLSALCGFFLMPRRALRSERA